MKNQARSHVLVLLAFGLVLLLPGCRFLDWLREKFGTGVKPLQTQPISNSNNHAAAAGGSSLFVPEDGSKVLATMNGRPLVTENSLAQELKALGDANQEVKMMLALYGEDEIKRGLVQRKVASAIYQKFLQDEGIEVSKEYQDELARLIDAVKDQFNQMYFLKTVPVTINEQEKRSWYEQNKETVPNLKVSEGGIKAMGVLFDSEDKAKAFVSKAKEAKGDLNKAAKLSDISADTVKDFKLVNAQSVGVDEPVKEAILGIKSFPATELVKTDNGVWVVAATGKEESSYRPYEQIANEIGQLLDRTKRQEMGEKKLNELRKSYDVVVNQDLDRPVGSGQEMQQQAVGMAEQLEQDEIPQVARPA